MRERLVCGLCFVWVLGSFMTRVTHAADPNLVAWWTFDEGSGTLAKDSSGNGNDASFQGAPQWVSAGKLGGALNFDGIAAYLAAPDSESLDINGDQLSLTAWVNGNDWSAANHVIRKIADTGTGAIYFIRVQPDTIRIDLSTSGGVTIVNGSTVLATNEWLHVALSYDGAEARIFVNGELDVSMAVSGEITQTDNEVRIGRGEPAGYFAGMIDDARIYSRGLTQEEIQNVMLGDSLELAANPSPADQAVDIQRNATLSWIPGEFAQTHNVYLGTHFDDVNDAVLADAVSQGQDVNSFDADRLDFGQTYYWRVDEVNGAPDNTVFRGDIWSFTTEPLSVPITPVAATASSSFGVSVAENTINGSGLVDDLHNAAAADMWISGGIPATIEYAFDRAYKLHELWIWNSNQTIEPFIGFGAKDIVVEHSLDGENWTVLEGVGPLAQAPGLEGYAHNNTIDFGGAKAQHVRMSINTVQGFAPQASLSEVRFFYIPTFPTGPNPESGSTGVPADVTLSWARDGREAAGHDIYLGSDPNDLPLAGRVTESRFDTLAADLQLGQTNYWQVVEVNDAMNPSEWAGEVWSFTTVDVISVDDMESYRDEEFLEIWATWIDGFDDPANNGAVVGAVPSMGDFSPETTSVYGGSQSLPIHFDNSAVPLSEATRTFDVAMDWTRHGVQSLVLFFGGSPANTGGQLYIKINDTKVVYDGSSSDLMNLGWNKWTIPLSSVSASTLGRVTSLTIGIEGNGSGVIYVDEIRLTTDTRVVVTPTEPSDEALVAHYAFDGDASDSTGQSPGTLVGLTNFVPGVKGEALRVDGINAYVAIDGLFYDSDGLTEVTVTTWIRTDTEDDQIIASFDRDNYWRLEINLSGAGPGQVGWDVMTDEGQLDYGSSSRVDDGEWHHVAGVFDNGTSTIFIDGYHEAPATRGSTFGTGSTRYGFVGANSEATTFNGALGGTPSFYIGDVDDLRIYQRALSAAEVAGMAGRTEPFEQP